MERHLRQTLEHSGGLEMSLQKNNSKMYQCPSAETQMICGRAQV